MGAGHDGAARNLATQLREQGCETEVRDFLDSGPLKVGAALRSGYQFELKHLPGAYDATYRLWYRVQWLCPIVAWITTLLTARRVLRWVRRMDADVVVSTYPLATLCLGRLRATGRLSIPAVNFITDFGVHPLWVHKGIDLNLAIHDGPAFMAASRTGRPSIACGPVVSPAFDPQRLPDRATARAGLGLRPEQKAVLVVAGSWGVGDVESTWSAITATGAFTPVVVCGRDAALFAKVRSLADAYEGESVVLGWTDQMPELIVACDTLVENAGGLTSLEAMRAGLPVISFQPIAGHGRENTARMHDAGVSRLATDVASLGTALHSLTTGGEARAAQVASAAAMFRSPPADLILEAPRYVPAELPSRRAPVMAFRLAVASISIAALGWVGLTSGVAVATEAGAGVAHPASGNTRVAYIGVRLSGAELTDPIIVGYLRTLHLTAIIDSSTAATNAAQVRQLAAMGINLANGGLGLESVPGHDHDSLPWARAERDASAGRRLALLIDRPITVSVPGRRVTAWDLLDSGQDHMSIVVPNHVYDAGRVAPYVVFHLAQRTIYMVNGLDATPAQLESVLAQIRYSLQDNHLSAAPLAKLT
jgi:UDP-N-acetylglucosamine:LPS N-acetylglucosamine transferase